MFIIKKNTNNKLSMNRLVNKSNNLDSNEVYEVKYNDNNDNKDVKKRYRFLRIFIEDKKDNSKVNLTIPLIFFPFAIFFKNSPNIIEINAKESLVKIYLN